MLNWTPRYHTDAKGKEETRESLSKGKKRKVSFNYVYGGLRRRECTWEFIDSPDINSMSGNSSILKLNVVHTCFGNDVPSRANPIIRFGIECFQCTACNMVWVPTRDEEDNLI